MDIQLLNSISDQSLNTFGDFLLGKIQRTIENPLSIIFDPINQTSREVIHNISGNLQEITGSENKKGLAAVNETIGGLLDNSINNISPTTTLLLALGATAVLVIALKV